MQVRLWGTPDENQEMIVFFKSNLSKKVKIISQPYLSKNGVTQRVYIEIDLENKNYRKCPVDHISTRKELLRN